MQVVIVFVYYNGSDERPVHGKKKARIDCIILYFVCSVSQIIISRLTLGEELENLMFLKLDVEVVSHWSLLPNKYTQTEPKQKNHPKIVAKTHAGPLGVP